MASTERGRALRTPAGGRAPGWWRQRLGTRVPQPPPSRSARSPPGHRPGRGSGPVAAAGGLPSGAGAHRRARTQLPRGGRRRHRAATGDASIAANALAQREQRGTPLRGTLSQGAYTPTARRSARAPPGRPTTRRSSTQGTYSELRIVYSRGRSWRWDHRPPRQCGCQSRRRSRCGRGRPMPCASPSPITAKRGARTAPPSHSPRVESLPPTFRSLD
jgi:hypothetical protein